VLRDTDRNAGTPGSFGPHVNLMMFDGALDVGPLVWRLHVLSTGLVEDLSLVVYPGSRDDGVRLDLQANPGLYSDADVQQHYRRFLLFLERFLAAGSDAALTTIDILTDTERAVLLRARQPDAAILTLPDIFARAAATNPASVAVRFEGRSVTYTELDESSNRLARMLVRYGSRPARRTCRSTRTILRRESTTCSPTPRQCWASQSPRSALAYRGRCTGWSSTMIRWLRPSTRNRPLRSPRPIVRRRCTPTTPRI
jgi:non-ribosomal peptide synthetase component F